MGTVGLFRGISQGGVIEPFTLRRFRGAIYNDDTDRFGSEKNLVQIAIV